MIKHGHESSFSDEEETLMEIEVFAPPGPLGLVIGSLNHDLPIVREIERSCVFSEVNVGDMLIRIDDEDVSKMSTTKIELLIMHKIKNPVRKLTFITRSNVTSTANDLYYSKKKEKRKKEKRKREKRKKEKNMPSGFETDSKDETEERKGSFEKLYNRNKDWSITMENNMIESNASDSHRSKMTKNNNNLVNESISNEIDFLKDPVHEMTYGRRIALKMMNNKYYNPHAEVKSDDEDRDKKPSLEKGWAYFEHNVLTRYILKPENDRKENEIERAVPGENKFPTRLYCYTSTPLNQMGDFGIGAGLYFFTMRSLFLLTLFAGIISIPNILYYNSSSYGTSDSGSNGLRAILLKGSAICSDVSWVPCPTCRSGFSTSSEKRLLAKAQQTRFSTSREGLDFALKNNCESPPLTQGMLHYATMIFMCFGVYLMNKKLDRMSIEFDEDEQTARDYSLVVKNPPPDATDPEEWKMFFSQFDNAHVTFCTISLDNDSLVKSLVERRDLCKKIQMLVPPGTKLEDTNLAILAAEHKLKRNFISRLIAIFLHPFGVCLDLPAAYAKVIVLNAEIFGLLNVSFPVTRVFIIFETEEAKRHVLDALSLGIVDKLRNNIEAISNKKYLFRSKYALDVSEAEEPSAIIWGNLNVKVKSKFIWVSINLFVTFCALICIAPILWIIDQEHTWLTFTAIYFFSHVFPVISRTMTNMERHSSESSFQTSLYIKIAFFRFVVYVIVIDVITAFTLYLVDSHDGLLFKVYGNFFSLLVYSNILQLSDIFGLIDRCVLGPRAQDQDSMNLYFQGTNWDLSDRYTNMSNITFLCFFYCTLYPLCFFISSMLLLVTYFVDKYSIMRTWARAPHCGTSISEINKHVFSPTALIVMIIMSSYFWSGFPYDNLCEDGIVNETYVGGHLINATSLTPSEYLNIHQNQTSYKFCNQNLFKTNSFPALSRYQGENQWMTKDQELITDIFGMTSIVAISLLLLQYCFCAFKFFFDAYRGITRFHAQHFHIKFSDVKSRCAYIS